MRHDRVNQRWRLRARQQQHFARLHFQDLIDGHKLLALLGGRGFAALPEFGG